MIGLPSETHGSVDVTLPVHRYLEAVRLDLAYEVTEAFYALLLARERLRLASEDASLSGEFLAQTRHKHETGDVGQVEVLRRRSRRRARRVSSGGRGATWS